MARYVVRSKPRAVEKRSAAAELKVGSVEGDIPATGSRHVDQDPTSSPSFLRSRGRLSRKRLSAKRGD